VEHILFIVGASKQNKIYPKEKLLEVANNLSDKKIEVIWANDKEKEVAQYLQNNANNVTMCEKMNLDNLKLKIKNSSLIIGGDTGPTHMAWGLNIPSITIFGNTPEKRNTYITDINKVIKSVSYVDALKLDKNDFSIHDIDANEISSMALELLK
jgi:heptosyltransferase-1